LNKSTRCAPTEGERALAERLLRALRNGGDVRRQKVTRIRTKVRSRTYENELKLTVALERLARSLGGPSG